MIRFPTRSIRCWLRVEVCTGVVMRGGGLHLGPRGCVRAIGRRIGALDRDGRVGEVVRGSAFGTTVSGSCVAGGGPPVAQSSKLSLRAGRRMGLRPSRVMSTRVAIDSRARGGARFDWPANLVYRISLLRLSDRTRRFNSDQCECAMCWAVVLISPAPRSVAGTVGTAMRAIFRGGSPVGRMEWKSISLVSGIRWYTRDRPTSGEWDRRPPQER